MRLLLPLFFALVGCGEVIGVDTHRPLRACDSSQPFGAFEPIAELGSVATDANPTLTDDELTLYFLSDRAAPDADHLQIWTATRPTRVAPWQNVHVVGELADDSSQFSGVAVSGDGKTLYYSRTSPDFTRRAVYVAQRTASDGPFGAPRELFDHPWWEFELALSRSGELFVSMQHPTTREYRLWSVRPPVFDDASQPQLVFPGPIGWLEGAPAISPDERSLYFSLNRERDTRLYVATRPAADQPFGTPVVVSEVDTAERGERASWISPDNCRMYGATFTKGELFASGEFYWEVAVAKRPP